MSDVLTVLGIAALTGIVVARVVYAATRPPLAACPCPGECGTDLRMFGRIIGSGPGFLTVDCPSCSARFRWTASEVTMIEPPMARPAAVVFGNPLGEHPGEAVFGNLGGVTHRITACHPSGMSVAECGAHGMIGGECEDAPFCPACAPHLV